MSREEIIERYKKWYDLATDSLASEDECTWHLPVLEAYPIIRDLQNAVWHADCLFEALYNSVGEAEQRHITKFLQVSADALEPRKPKVKRAKGSGNE